MARRTIVFASVLLWGCGEWDHVEPACVEGRQRACFCDSGESGLMVCSAAGEWDPCTCHGSVLPPDASRDGLAVPPDAQPLGLHHYELVDISPATADWYEARAAAEARSHLGVPGHLAVITSAEEESLVLGLFPGIHPEYVWLGATDEGSEGRWRWITGENWAYTDWGPDEPNGENFENCLDFGDYSSAWNDEECSRPLAFFLVEYESE